jgi:hydrogenase maturation protease
MHKLRHTPGDPEEALSEALRAFAGEGPIYVLGLGYVDKADDGAGVVVANTLKKTFPDYSFSEHDGVEGTVLDISEKPGPATVFFVDATDLKSPPGTIVIVPRSDIKETEISTHRVPVALLAAMLEREDKETVVLCIQIKSLEFRGEMSREVSSAAAKIANALHALIAARSEQAR